MSGIEEVEERVETVNGETVVVTVTKPGEFVVCNLASLSLGHLNVEDGEMCIRDSCSSFPEAQYRVQESRWLREYCRVHGI